MQHTTPTKKLNKNKNTNQYIVYLKNDQYVAKHSEAHETCAYLLSVLFVHQLINAKHLNWCIICLYIFYVKMKYHFIS